MPFRFPVEVVEKGTSLVLTSMDSVAAEDFSFVTY